MLTTASSTRPYRGASTKREKLMAYTTRYDGFRNYATWKVYTEMFHGEDCREFRGNCLVRFNTLPEELRIEEREIRSLAGVLEGRVTYHILKKRLNFCHTGPDMPFPEQLAHAQEFALAFLHDVDWLEIADHVLDDIQPPGTFTDYEKASKEHAESGGFLLVIGYEPITYKVTDEPETWGRTPEQIAWMDAHPECMWDETAVSAEYPSGE